MICILKDKKDFQRFTLIGNKVLVYINEQDKGDSYLCDELVISCSTKDNLISSLIKANYPSDRMDAIRNNYELVKDGTAGDKAEEYITEYLAMQDWRRQAKELAAEIMEEYNNQNN